MPISHLRGLAAPMKCDIVVKPPHDRPWFTSGDVIAGHVGLEVKKETSITRVAVSLKIGKLTMTFVPVEEEFWINGYPDTRGLKITKKTLDSSHPSTHSTIEPGDGTVCRAGRLHIPFCLQFPILQSSQFFPPPSLDIREAGLRATVAYSIRAEITTASMVRSRLVHKQAILFRPPNHAVIYEPLALPTTNIRAMVAADGLNPDITPPYLDPYLPQYSPALLVDLEFPSPTILSIGQPLPMNLSVTATEDLMACLGSVRLRKLQVTLKATTAVHSGPASRETSSSVTLCSVNTDILLVSGAKQGTCKIDSALWKKRPIPEIPLSFSSANVSRSYVMDVVVGFSSGRRENIENQSQGAGRTSLCDLTGGA
ncbi:unnamed protein product [Parascedosporium putredinis]|uniref:Arrestin-like N-terminal domain-containing protein n=1 Tax=Parascedosporium putredinis TaxID=1442378 RepID=A0A9P1MAV9_9PEZI|nr:unnamed protein product [Parascedosporium putredinis]CAI7998382.1 unnamed protein product [Parascedosporium putredinis]